MAAPILVRARGPFDLALSTRAAARFLPEPPEDSNTYRQALRVGNRAVVMRARQTRRTAAHALLEVSSQPASQPAALKRMAEWVFHADLDLRLFAEAVRGHAVMEPIVHRYWGLKPFRVPSLFDMALIAVTEQQISLAAAFRIRARLIESFGKRVGGQWVYPTPSDLAPLAPDDLKACGLSTRKAEYIIGLARDVASGELDLAVVKSLPLPEARALLLSIRGIGPWAAEYILVRGVGLMDVVPAGDLGIRTLVGYYLGDGSRMSAEEVRRALKPFEPWRGLATFYLMVDYRLAMHEGRVPWRVTSTDQVHPG
ncbi:MAG: DNA-3-methyladenine glycosylase family protein [Candidatus Geothermincolia bacterium]